MRLHLVILYVHLVAAMFWIGEMLVLALVMAPIARSLPGAEERVRLYRVIGRQSRPWMLGALVLLIGTGIGNLWTLGMRMSALRDSNFYASPFGRVLAGKVLLVLVIVAMTLIHDAAMRRMDSHPDHGTAGTGPPANALPFRTLGRWIGRVNLLLSLIVVWLGLRLVAGF